MKHVPMLRLIGSEVREYAKSHPVSSSTLAATRHPLKTRWHLVAVVDVYFWDGATGEVWFEDANEAKAWIAKHAQPVANPY